MSTYIVFKKKAHFMPASELPIVYYLMWKVSCVIRQNAKQTSENI